MPKHPPPPKKTTEPIKTVKPKDKKNEKSSTN